MLNPLPIDSILPEIVANLRHTRGLVICAPPGTGKTTRVPRALLDSGFANSGEVLILEPRRLAARLAAQRVAEELGEEVGKTVGFSIRWETVDSPDTRIRFATEGVLVRRFVSDPLLEGVSVVILDEFHERHIHTDVALAFLKRLQRTASPDLKILVMSATLDARPIAEFLGGLPVMTCAGTCFESFIEYETKESEQPLHERMPRAVSMLMRSGLDGDVLAFLPGAAEIRLAGAALSSLAASTDLLITPLHGDLPGKDQLQAVRPQQRRKVILATNVAETSITIPGIAAVVDSGLARIAGHSAWSGLPTTSIKKVSRASATQRAGRAGRTRSGRVLRLYTRTDYESRPEHEIPEIKRADLAEVVLTLHGAGIRDIRSFPWLEAPPNTALEAAEDLLKRLGALDSSKEITATGRRMLRFPVHPRLARLIVEGERHQNAEDCCALAALLSERDIRIDARSEIHRQGPHRLTRATANSDLTDLLDRFREAESFRFEPRRLAHIGLDARAVENVERARRQLVRLAIGKKAQPKRDAPEEALRIATLAAFPDRVARRRKQGSQELVLSTAGEALLSSASAVHDAPLLVAVDAEQRAFHSRAKGGTGVLVRLASAIEPEWLAALFPEAISDRAELRWNAPAGRVDEIRRVYYDQLTLEEIHRPAPVSEEAGRVLSKAALELGLSIFQDGDFIPALRTRLSLLASSMPEETFPELDDEGVRKAVETLCLQRRNLAELKSVSLVESIISGMIARQKELLRRETPEKVVLRAGRKVAVHYESGKPPWIESRLQDFFGMTATLKICSGRVPLTIHLLAPSGRPVQVTQDLAGFWKNHYPSIRRELQRRYPKHAWPEPAKVHAVKRLDLPK